MNPRAAEVKPAWILARPLRRLKKRRNRHHKPVFQSLPGQSRRRKRPEHRAGATGVGGNAVATHSSLNIAVAASDRKFDPQAGKCDDRRLTVAAYVFDNRHDHGFAGAVALCTTRIDQTKDTVVYRWLNPDTRADAQRRRVTVCDERAE